MDAPRRPTIEEKIEEANALYAAWKGRLRRDPEVCELLERLRQCLDATARAMEACRLGEACRRCEEEQGGSCCGAGIENRYVPLQLLVNLLLGTPLPKHRRYADSCHFLDTRGCCLKARHVLCVNYLCKPLERALSPEEREVLEAAVGEELHTGFILHEALRQRIGPSGRDR